MPKKKKTPPTLVIPKTESEKEIEKAKIDNLMKRYKNKGVKRTEMVELLRKYNGHAGHVSSELRGRFDRDEPEPEPEPESEPELDTEVREAVKRLGYDEDLYHKHKLPPLFDKEWSKLTKMEKKDLAIIGYEDKEFWEQEQTYHNAERTKKARRRVNVGEENQTPKDIRYIPRLTTPSSKSGLAKFIKSGHKNKKKKTQNRKRLKKSKRSKKPKRSRRKHK